MTDTLQKMIVNPHRGMAEISLGDELMLVVLTLNARLGITAKGILFVFVGKPDSVPLPVKRRVGTNQRDERSKLSR